LQVSPLALGSWRTYEHLPRETGEAVMRAAREQGINFLDDARYNDETGSAPLKTGYSEVVFGELFRRTGWNRDRVLLANKLWWEFWPAESAEAELDGSLGRMGVDHVDLIYAERPPAGLALEEVVRQVGGLISKGKARAWGVLNWDPSSLREAAELARDQGVPPPCAAQLPYSLVQRSPVEDPEMLAALAAAGAGVVASYVMAGGVLTGKYSQRGGSGRMAGRLDDKRVKPAVPAGDKLRALAESWGESPGALAIAFALLNPAVVSVLFGATSPQQVTQNCAAVDLFSRLTDDQRTALVAVG
jgi:aryl-alcohol dehydrogenase-like predicted oxidoreductase